MHPKESLLLIKHDVVDLHLLTVNNIHVLLFHVIFVSSYFSFTVGIVPLFLSFFFLQNHQRSFKKRINIDFASEGN